MIKLFLMVIISLFVLSPFAQAQSYNPEGYWLMEDGRKVIHIASCQEESLVYDGFLCGRIYWIIKGDGEYFFQKRNVTSKSALPLCRINILTNFTQDKSKANEWKGGKLFKSDVDRAYKARLEMKGDNEIIIEEYGTIPLWGKIRTQKYLWQRVSKKDYPACKTIQK